MVSHFIEHRVDGGSSYRYCCDENKEFIGNCSGRDHICHGFTFLFFIMNDLKKGPCKAGPFSFPPPKPDQTEVMKAL